MGMLRRLIILLQALADAMAQEHYGWKLLGAWTTAVGPICTVIDLWELPDVNTFFEANVKWRTPPEFQAFRAVTSEVMVEEMVTMVSKAPLIASKPVRSMGEFGQRLQGNIKNPTRRAAVR